MCNDWPVKNAIVYLPIILREIPNTFPKFHRVHWETEQGSMHCFADRVKLNLRHRLMQRVSCVLHVPSSVNQELFFVAPFRKIQDIITKGM